MRGTWANEHSEQASHGRDSLAGEYNASPATITRDAIFAEAVDKDARGHYFVSRFIGAARFKRPTANSRISMKQLTMPSSGFSS
jgi:hypothetical protein